MFLVTHLFCPRLRIKLGSTHGTSSALLEIPGSTMEVANYSIVSIESPQWMKQPFESNRSFDA